MEPAGMEHRRVDNKDSKLNDNSPNKPLICKPEPETYKPKIVTLYRNVHRTWLHSKGKCEQNNSTLMSVRTPEDVAAIENKLRTVKGIKTLTSTYDVGGYRPQGEDTFCWYEGGELKYELNVPKYPPDTSKMLCLAMKFAEDYGNVKFSQQYCDTVHTHNLCLCEKYAE